MADLRGVRSSRAWVTAGFVLWGIVVAAGVFEMTRYQAGHRIADAFVDGSTTQRTTTPVFGFEAM